MKKERESELLWRQEQKELRADGTRAAQQIGQIKKKVKRGYKMALGIVAALASKNKMSFLKGGMVGWLDACECVHGVCIMKMMGEEQHG